MLDQVARLSVSQKLFEARSLVICGEIDSDLARGIVEQLLALAAASHDDITLYLHSPGGHVEAGDTTFSPSSSRASSSSAPVGWRAPAPIYIGVPREQLHCLPNTRFLLHQPAGGAGRCLRSRSRPRDPQMRARSSRIISEQTGQPLKRSRGHRAQLLVIAKPQRAAWSARSSLDRRAKR
jgi:ATP-dependent Clp protease protease subunit